MVASPRPKRIFEIRPIKWLLEKKGSIVICAGGGGIPTMYAASGKLQGVEAVIDKDLCSALLAEQLESDLLVIATDVSAAFIDFGKPTQKAIAQAHPDDMEKNSASRPAPWDQRSRRPASSPAILEKNRSDRFTLGYRGDRPGQGRHAYQYGDTWHNLLVRRDVNGNV